MSLEEAKTNSSSSWRRVLNINNNTTSSANGSPTDSPSLTNSKKKSTDELAPVATPNKGLNSVQGSTSLPAPIRTRAYTQLEGVNSAALCPPPLPILPLHLRHSHTSVTSASERTSPASPRKTSPPSPSSPSRTPIHALTTSSPLQGSPPIRRIVPREMAAQNGAAEQMVGGLQEMLHRKLTEAKAREAMTRQLDEEQPDENSSGQRSPKQSRKLKISRTTQTEDVSPGVPPPKPPHPAHIRRGTSAGLPPSTHLPIAGYPAVPDAPDMPKEEERCRAKGNFKGERTEDLSFNTGDIIIVKRKKGKWWEGTCNGKTGLFPSNFVSLITDSGGLTETNSDAVDTAAKESQTEETSSSPPVEVEEADGDIIFEEVEEELSGRMIRILSSGPTKLLIGVMASKNTPEPHFMDAFLLTRRYFISGQSLLNELISIFKRGRSEDESEEEFERWQKIIQGRVMNVLYKWVDSYFFDFLDEESLLLPIVTFVSVECPANPLSIKLLKALRKRKREAHLNLPDPAQEKQLDMMLDRLLQATTTSSTSIPIYTVNATSSNDDSPTSPRESSDAGIVRTENSATNAPTKPPKDRGPHIFGGRRHTRVRSLSEKEKESAKTIAFLDINPKDLAQQLTIVEQALFLAIQPVELLYGAWKRKDRQTAAPHVLELIDWFNKINSWVASEIVLQHDVKKRRAYVTRFIQTADECRKLKNYNATKEIISALNRSCIGRLAWTWKGIPKQELAIFNELTTLMDHVNNYKNYRLEFKSVDPPKLPYVGVHLQDLLATEELPTRLKSTNHVNFKKMRNIEKACRPIIGCHNLPYDLQTRHPLQRFLTSEVITLSEADLHEASKAAEPTPTKP